MKKNLEYIKKFRDAAEHSLLGDTDVSLTRLFQACCLNFEEILVQSYGPSVGIAKELSLALQFNKISADQLDSLQRSELPGGIAAIFDSMESNVDRDILDSETFSCRVHFTREIASKSRAHELVSLSSDADGKGNQVVIRQVDKAARYPYKPRNVVECVQEHVPSFTMHEHTKAWKRFKVRPSSDASDKSTVVAEYCSYDARMNRYFYTEVWVKKLIEFYCS